MGYTVAWDSKQRNTSEATAQRSDAQSGANWEVYIQRKNIYPEKLSMDLAELLSDTLMRHRTKNVKYHEGVGGIGLRWPLDSAAEDKGCGHKGPGRRSSRACVLQLRGERYESMYVSQMYALCIEQLKLMKSLTSGAQLLIGCGKTSLITTVKLFSCTQCAHQYGGKNS